MCTHVLPALAHISPIYQDAKHKPKALFHEHWIIALVMSMVSGLEWGRSPERYSSSICTIFEQLINSILFGQRKQQKENISAVVFLNNKDDLVQSTPIHSTADVELSHLDLAR
jgi:hypothetical protein